MKPSPLELLAKRLYLQSDRTGGVPWTALRPRAQSPWLAKARKALDSADSTPTQPALTKCLNPFLPDGTRVVLELLIPVHCEDGTPNAVTHDGDPRAFWNTDKAAFEKAADAWLDDFGPEVAACGGKISFMAGRQWWLACARWRPSWPDEMTAQGHFVGLHARDGYTGYKSAMVLPLLEQPQVASGVLADELGGFPDGWTITGLADRPGHGADARSIAAEHLAGIWTGDDADDILGARKGSKFTVIASGSGSTSKVDAMVRAIRTKGAVEVYNGTDPDAVSGTADYTLHGMMLDAAGLTSSKLLLGISPRDIPETVLEILRTAFATPGVRAATFETLLDGWGGQCFWDRTAGRAAGDNHWWANG